jgi:3-(3-hydroxy-phenyl)propionate hydroxylase
MASYTYTRHPYRPPPELQRPGPRRPVVIIGSGPVGLSCAIDLALHGIPTVVLDDDDTVSLGSRAICWAKRTLEIWDRLGIGQRVVDKGVTWSVGRVFHGDHELYRFDMLPEAGNRRPAFVNLQQYYVEDFLIQRTADFPDLIDLRWKNEVVDVAQREDGARLLVETQDGNYHLDADWVIAADGARSPTRTRMGLAFTGQRFEERFLIADVRMQAAFPTERLFWFEPTFHPGQSALLHRQPDGIFRIDFQLGPDADPEVEKRPERVMPRVRAIVGETTPVELEWCSVYSFRCARLERFVYNRIIFVGDSAHVVSPFGARGGNGGVQDADNLCWKLALVLKGQAPVELLETYTEERGYGADENIKNSSRTTNFMTPKTTTERRFRDSVLALAPHAPFARALLNAGRLSRPCSLAGQRLQTPDTDPLIGLPCPDAPALDPDGNEAWLLDHLGTAFTLLIFTENPPCGALASLHPSLRMIAMTTAPKAMSGATVLIDHMGLARQRYVAQPDDAILIRPDTHIAARIRTCDLAAVASALDRATGRAAVDAASKAA